ncbi:hypothetical protein [Streptomyces huiliensis]|uniref:hypothetical protein n=1 Tax=Streptomyces huiliensis TaxID=2876027 RepID=UPI001CBBFE29|nr:hypothetical protein [Streptomyces huiliensis]MBZ4322609.1 hypothetical protein [Streptomyces huiliensis]
MGKEESRIEGGMVTDPGTGEDRFFPPTEEQLSAAGEETAERSAEQADFTVPQENLSGIPARMLDAKDELAESIRRQGAAGARAVESFLSDTGNVQGVGSGFGRPGGPTEPGAPTLAVFVAEEAPTDRVRSVLVDAMGVQAAADLPLTVHKSGIIDAQAHRCRIRPAPGGVSVGHYRITAGTLGCLAVGRSAPRNSRLLALSNNHVPPGSWASSWSRAAAGTSAKAETPDPSSGRGTRTGTQWASFSPVAVATPSAIRCRGWYPRWTSTCIPDSGRGGADP